MDGGTKLLIIYYLCESILKIVEKIQFSNRGNKLELNMLWIHQFYLAIIVHSKHFLVLQSLSRSLKHTSTGIEVMKEI
jgi:hypothetical protein